VTATAVILEHRGVLKVAGADRVAFLQGIVSNDVERAGPDSAIWAAFLTPQGKFLHEFFLAAQGESLLLDCEAERATDLLRRLKLYKLRAQVTLEPVEDLVVAVAFGGGTLERLGLSAEPGHTRSVAQGIAYVDPRLATLGARLLLPRAGAEAALAAAGLALGSLADYDALRIAAGVPDGSRDLEVEKATLLESGFDELGGVDWQKGCYMGQELTARMKYRGLAKKRLIPVEIAGPAPEAGTPILREGKEAGELRSVAAHNGGATVGLALLRLEALDGDAPLTAGDAEVTPRKPDWAKF
jgi:folate-binding protein YgfZ